MLNKDQYATSGRYEARIKLNKKFRTNPKLKFDLVFDQFPEKEGLRVLELGCGTGLFWLVNSGRIPDSWAVTLSDYSGGMLMTARRYLERSNHQFQFDVVNAEDIHYCDKSFDLVLANNMLYHIENRAAALSHISRILDDNGIFIATTFSNNDMAELNLRLYEFLESRNKKFRFKEFSFSMENGLKQLEPFFKDIELLKHNDILNINETEPVVDYYLSMNGMYGGFDILPDEDVDAFRIFINNIIKVNGSIPATKESAIFVCRNR